MPMMYRMPKCIAKALTAKILPSRRSSNATGAAIPMISDPAASSVNSRLRGYSFSPSGAACEPSRSLRSQSAAIWLRSPSPLAHFQPIGPDTLATPATK